ncbi:MAG: hypothetical protein ACREOO_12415 [bacterium]
MFYSGRFFRQEGCAEQKGRVGFALDIWRQTWLVGALCLWLLPQMVHAQQTITNLSVDLTDYTAGNRAAYTLSFLPQSGLTVTDKIVITFPTGFDISQVTVAGPQDGFNGGLSPSISGQNLILTRDGEGENAGAVQVTVSFALVTNHQTPGSYKLGVRTQTSLNQPKNTDNGNGPVFTIVPTREPFGNIALRSTKPKLPANGADTTLIFTSQPIKDAGGNNVLAGKLLTVAVNDPRFGRITTDDAAPLLPGLQIRTVGQGHISFAFQAGTSGGTATISVSGGSDGAASGSISLSVNELRILSVAAGRDTVSSEQTGVPVTMILQNVGRDSIELIDVDLTFNGETNFFNILDVSPSGRVAIPGNSQTLELRITVGVPDTEGEFSIDGRALASVIDTLEITADGAVTADSWFVQRAPRLSYIPGSLRPVNASVGSSHQFSIRVRNEGTAALHLDPERTRLLLQEGANLFEARLDANYVRTVTNGDTTIAFRSTAIPSGFPLGTYVPRIEISGTHNGANFFVDTLSVGSVRLQAGELVEIVSITPSQNAVTQGMQRVWTIDVEVRNNNSFPLQLVAESMQIVILGEGLDGSYSIESNRTFGSGSRTLGSDSSAILRFVVTRTGTKLGTASIVAEIELEGNNKRYSAKSFGTQGGFLVQTPAEIAISLEPSQSNVTQNQTRDWNVAMRINNSGGSAVRVEFLDEEIPLKISLQDSAGYVIGVPDTLVSIPNQQPDLVLGNSTRELNFTVNTTGSRGGRKTIQGQVKLIETNTGRVIDANTLDNEPVQVTVQTPARIRITETRLAQVFNGDSVNFNQAFQVRVKFINTGEEGLDGVWVRLASSGSSEIGPEVVQAAGDSAVFEVQADRSPNPHERFTASIDSAIASNTNTRAEVGPPEEPGDDTTRVVIMTTAFLQLLSVTTDLNANTVSANSRQTWHIFVALRASQNPQRNRSHVQLNAPLSLALSLGARPVGKDYDIDSPSELSGGGLFLRSGQTDTLTYTVTKVGPDGGELIVTATATGRDVNDLRPLLVSRNDTIQVISQTLVSISNTQFAAGVNQSGGIGLVNQNQVFEVEVHVQNIGFERVDSAFVSIEKTAGNAGEGEAQIIVAKDTILAIPNPDVRIGKFRINAGSLLSANGDFYEFKVRIDSARTPTATATIGPPLNSDEVKVKVQSPAQLEVHVATNMPFNRLAAGQPFEIRASVLNRGQAQYDGSGLLQIKTHPGDYLITNIPKQFTQGDTVIWEATPPANISQLRQDQFVIEIVRTPQDLNIREPAVVLADTAAMMVELNAAALALRKVSIIEPEGAKDSTLSTEQTFTLRADLQWQRARNVKALLILPDGFVTDPLNGSLEIAFAETDGINTADWRIKAPAQPLERALFRVEVTATDLSLASSPLPTAVDSLPLSFVPRANLSFSAEVTNPPAAIDRVVSIGQSFEVSAILNNRGQAQAVGPDSIKLILPPGYDLDRRVETTLIKSSVPSGRQRLASWLVLAPNRESPQTGEEIVLELTKVAIDENTNQIALVDQEQDNFIVIVEERRLVVNAMNTNRRSPVARGQDSLAVLDLELQNTGSGDNSNDILLQELRVYVKDQRGNNIAPGALLRELRLVEAGNPSQEYGRVQLTPSGRNNPVIMMLANPVKVSFDASRLVSLLADLTTADSVTAFSFSFQQGSDLVAHDEVSDSLVTVADAAGRTGPNFNVVSPLSVLVDASFNNFYNYPNPLRPRSAPQGVTQFVYYLPKDSDVSLEIFSMLGELVWQAKYLATDPEGRTGNHGLEGPLKLPGIFWNGCNGNGDKVLNGVYLAVLKTNSGTVKTKVAVIK